MRVRSKSTLFKIFRHRTIAATLLLVLSFSFVSVSNCFTQQLFDLINLNRTQTATGCTRRGRAPGWLKDHTPADHTVMIFGVMSFLSAICRFYGLQNLTYRNVSPFLFVARRESVLSVLISAIYP